MPRQARLDAPGTLHHVILRGRERETIVADAEDRAAFLRRPGGVATATGATLYAWALLPTRATGPGAHSPTMSAGAGRPGGAPEGKPPALDRGRAGSPGGGPRDAARDLHVGDCEGGRKSGPTRSPLNQQRIMSRNSIEFAREITGSSTLWTTRHGLSKS